MTPLAARIRKRLDALRIDPTPTSVKAGMSPSGIRNILEGKSQSPRGVTLQKLAIALQSSVEWLTTGEGDEFVDYDSHTRQSSTSQEDFGIAEVGGSKGRVGKRLTPNFIPEFAVRAGASPAGGIGIEVPVTDEDGNSYTGTLARAEWRIPDYYLSSAGLSLSQTHIIEIDGPSMLPDLKPEDRVIIDISDTNPGVDGIFAIWDNETQSVIVKNVQVVRGTDPQQINCISSNPTYSPFTLILDDATRIIGRVKRRITSI